LHTFANRSEQPHKPKFAKQCNIAYAFVPTRFVQN